MLDLSALVSLFFAIMFSSLGFFKQVECPEISRCTLPSCIFAHNAQPKLETLHDRQKSASEINNGGQQNSDGPRKKRRLSGPGGDNIETPQLAPMRERSKLALLAVDSSSLRSFARTVSPPTVRPDKSSPRLACDSIKDAPIHDCSTKSEGSLATARNVANLSLNPRILPNPPATHAVRMQLIKLLHQQMTRLNEAIISGQDPADSSLELSDQELIARSLEEEERVAKQNPAVYLNVIKLRITKLKKMRSSEWKEERLKQIAGQVTPAVSKGNSTKVIESDLSKPQEIALLQKLFAKQDGLSKHGYVPKPPSEDEVNQARDGMKAAQGFELCDRCQSRFQVFPGRRAEDGALTSGGICTYHPAKPRRPIPKDKADKIPKEAIFACCNQSIGESSGCTKATTHVFKVSEAKRLALIMPFKETPPNSSIAAPDFAVCFDCEMGYTTLGLELIRLTATSWLDGGDLVDVLVKPLGEILDLNSRFSGVWPVDYANALPYDLRIVGDNKSSKNDLHHDNRLRIVNSPEAARELLFQHLTPQTPLIGHALDNDLNVTRIIHPSIIDTVLLYPHPRGLPIRFGLKVLTKKYLNQDIQQGGAMGHDSKEDARAAGDLVRLKVVELWKSMKRDGWTVRNTEFSPPLPGPSAKAFPFGSYIKDAQIAV